MSNVSNMLNCPNDGTALKTIVIENIPLDQCTVCGGYWLQRGELETLGKQHKSPLEPVVVGSIGITESARKCLQDGTQLREHEFAEHSGIKIDQCPMCQGVWLDKAELDSILHYLDEHIETDPTLSQRVMLFLYHLTEYPPLI
ncbi:MAG: zf-TFIIB domain-containing protein [Chloroflexota bacterium]